MKSPLHILHLEDDVMDAELVQETLLADGIECEITRVETEADFLAALEQGGFDLVFADYSLPSFDGFSALKVVQRKCPDLPVIFISGTMVEELPVEALKLGGTDYVLKGRLLRIVPSVKRAVREAEERAELARAQEALRRSEAYLRASENRWRKLFENSSAGIALVAPGGRYLATNLALQKMLGYTEEEFQRLTEADLLPEGELVAHQQLRAEAVRGLRQGYRMERRFRRKDGNLIWTDVSGGFVPATENQSAFFALVIVDINERKRAEEELRRAEEELRQNEISLREAQSELAHVSRVTTMGELAASIAHEINQPLAGMLTNANAGLRWLAGELPNLNETREAVRRIIRDGNRAGEIIGRIRALAKKAPPQKDWLDLNQAIREVIAVAGYEVTQHRVSLQTQLANDLPLILGDRIQLEQVILNLLINAIEAMSEVGEGPRELWVSSEKVTEVLGKPEEDTLAELEGTHVLIGVRDTGPGVDPKGLDRLFGAFYTTKPQGLGMGLAISRSIIEAHGGRLWAVANEPKGAVFQFTLPIR